MNTKHRYFLGMVLALFMIILFRNSWASDDAFITLRTVYNLLHGYGLTWNGAERVQVFSHPLWLFILVPFYILIRNPFFTLFSASVVFSIATVLTLFLKFTQNIRSTLTGFILLIMSKAFIDYSSSGLENPLTHLLIVLFASVYLLDREPARKKLFILSFIAGLSTLNRMDSLLLYIPALCIEILAERKNFREMITSVLTGFLPFIIWELFSLLYFGFPFPNTYYAKLTTGIAQNDLYQQGLHYYQNSITWDKVTLPVIGLGLIYSIFSRNKQSLALSLGIIFYLLYILRIGGDFMSGRFFSTVFLLSVILILHAANEPLSRLGNPYFQTTFITFFIILGLFSYYPPILTSANLRNTTTDHGVADEKLVYFRCCSLLNRLSTSNLPKIAQNAEQAKKEKTVFVIRESIGIYGFYAGPNVYIVDKVCLSDPLRARLPVTGSWRIGHFERLIPAGYMETIESGFQNKIDDLQLHEYYDKLSIITRGKIFTTERLKLIIAFNLGQYDYLLDGYNKSTQ